MARTRKHADLRREEILRATVAQIESQGIHALRMSDVARALSVSPALIVYHFQTKETLIAEAFTWAAEQDLDRLEKLCAGLPTALDRLSTALEWYAPTGRAKGWRLWIEGWAAALREPELRQVGREVDLRWKESLIAIIQDGVHSGEFTTPDPRGAAWRITALMDGLAVQTIVHRGIHDQEQSTAWARQFVARELAVDPAALARGSHEARKPSARGLPSVRSAKSPLMPARPAVGGLRVRSVGVTGVTALPAARQRPLGESSPRGRYRRCRRARARAAAARGQAGPGTRDPAPARRGMPAAELGEMGSGRIAPTPR